jgi:hypothetical protein
MPGWVDTFLFWDAVAVAALVFADWAIGEKKRAVMREKIGEWWVRVDDISFAALISEDARGIRRFFHRVFGPRWFSVRCVILSCAISVLLTTGFALTAAIRFAIMVELPEANTLSIILSLAFVVQNAAFAWMSLGLTMALLRVMERTVRPLVLLGCVLLDSAAALGFAFLSLLSGIILAFAADLYFRYSLGLLHEDPILVMLIMYVAIFGKPLFRAIVLSSVWPTLIHLAVAAVFWGSKLLRPLLKRPVGLILLRLHESQKGVLSLVAVAVGVAAKLVHLAAKSFAGTQ